jgi:EAL domain-containing protein (putative c-di-GMP-specific phosphodiesterase class I)
MTEPVIRLDAATGGREHLTAAVLIQRILSEARRQLEMDVAYVAELRDGFRLYRFVDGDRLPDAVRVGTSDPVEDTVAGRMTAGEIPPVIADVAGHDGAGLSEVRSAHIGALAGAPIRRPDGSIFGALVCFAHEPRPHLDDRSAGYLTLVARLLAEQLEGEIEDVDDLRRQLERVELALEPGSVDMVFQPLFDLTTGAVVGAEALARFPIEPMRPPNVWFEEARTIGRGVDLELAAMDVAVSRLAELPAGAFLSVNLSPETVVSPRLPHVVAGLAAERLVVEVPERAAVEDPIELFDAVQALRAGGIRLAADDAGAGLENLSHILELRPELIKFDVSLTHGLDADPVRRTLAASLVVVATRFDALVVAEGIETVGELEVLRELGFHYGQGFMLARPGSLPLPDRFDLGSEAAG